MAGTCPVIHAAAHRRPHPGVSPERLAWNVLSRKDPMARGIRASHGLGDKINKHQLRNIDRTNTKTLNKWSGF